MDRLFHAIAPLSFDGVPHKICLWAWENNLSIPSTFTAWVSLDKKVLEFCGILSFYKFEGEIIPLIVPNTIFQDYPIVFAL